MAAPPKEAVNQLLSLHGRAEPEQFLGRAQELCAQFPDSARLQNILGVANAELNRVEAAILCYRRALEIKPTFAAAHNNLGNMLRQQGLLQEAAQSFERALEINPNFAEAHNNLGNVLKDEGTLDNAIASYRRATELKPRYAEAHYNLGIALEKQGNLKQGIEHLKRAVHLRPDYAEAWCSLADTLADRGSAEAAAALYRRVLEINPKAASAQAKKLHQQAHMCDWTLWPEFHAVGSTLGIDGDAVVPFALLALEDDPVRHRLRAEKFACENFEQATQPLVRAPRARPAKLRIGYFSADFRAHALMYLMARLFKVHDRSRFEIVAYSYGPEEKDCVREDLERSVDCFRDVAHQTGREISDLARLDRIDVAVDLQGYTGKMRPEIFAFRAAPVQINYLGYPGTLGARFIDYIIADEVVIPRRERDGYSEQIIYVPASFLVNDDTRAISKRPLARCEFNLPEDAFVFCCFNGHYKISPREFDIWMRLLGKVDGSVLWLRSGRWAEDRLRKEAEARGVAGERLVFAGHIEAMDEHLARHRLADLFLDTFNYNAHSTASDALWAGLPVVTKAGRGFAARVSASLLTAVGLPELITGTENEYEALALDLALHREKLRAIRLKLAENRRTWPLFDTELFARRIERAYQQAYDVYLRGEPARSITVQ